MPRLRRASRLIAVAGLFLIGAPAHAQTWSGFLKPEIKKRFDGGKDEQEAAQVAFVAPDGWSSRYFLVDVAGRFNAPPLRPGRTFIFVAPVVEYHHGDAEPLRKQSAVHKLSSGVTVESQVNTDFLRPNFLFKATATRNLFDDTTEQAVSAFASVRVLRNFWPGQPSTDAARHRVLRYFPSIGFEHFRNLAIKNSGTVLAQPFSGSFTSLRLFVQAYPFNRAATPDKIRFSVEADGYIRKPTATSGPFPKAISSVSANATWYFVSEQRVGLGLTGDFGKMPAVNFLPQRRVVLALRFKTP